jgi:hypothetical protein
MTYIVQRQDRFYVVTYDGLDPLTGKKRRRWYPAGHDRTEVPPVDRSRGEPQTFCNQGGRFLNPESASQLVSRIIATTSLPRIRFHDVYRHHRRETPGHSFDTTRAGRHRR